MPKLVVEGLGKRYQLSGDPDEGSPFDLLRRRREPGCWQPAAEPAEQKRDFWALKDVSFTVEPGTVLGVIGANGVGKTTLLKILARVITPTEGRVIGSGGVVSLLELGAGFDPDLSARENILLNAAMLGVSRADVMGRYEQILEFAEAEKFADTPLKHYSSGMYLRLAFSVAINMEPSILLADEILAVGDQAFQERCLERVKQEAGRGLTVLFVSHDMESIVRVCNRTLWLHAGQIRGLGDPEEIVAEYQNSMWTRGGVTAGERGRAANRFAILHDVRVVTEDGREVRGVQTDQTAHLRMRFELLENHLYASGAYDIRARGQLVFRTGSARMRYFRNAGMWEATMRLPAHFYNEMTYSVVPSLTVARQGAESDTPGRSYSLMAEPLTFMVYGPDGSAPARGDKGLRSSGLLAPVFKWRFQHLEDQPAPAETDVARA
jgi:lipopolysaccharide transport system ATP-binding protein